MAKDTLQKDELIAVVWQDIESNAGWSAPADIDKAKTCECKTVGFFHHINGNNLLIKHNLAENKDADYTVIPTGCIDRIKLLQINEEFKVDLKKIKGKMYAYVEKSKAKKK